MASVADYTDAELLRRAVRSATAPHRRVAPRYVAIMARFGLGSTYAKQLCVRFDLDPEQPVSGN